MDMTDIKYFFRKILKKIDMDSWKDTWGRVDWGTEECYDPKKIERQIRSLLEKGINPNLINSKESESTPLHLVAKRNHCSSCIAPLLAAGAEIDKKDILGKTALSYAYANAPTNDTVHLKKTQGSVHTGNQKENVQSLDKSNFLILLEAGANVNLQDNTGRTLLMSVRSSTTLPKILLEYGADPDKQDDVGKTALMHWANHPPYISKKNGRIYDMTEGIELLAKHSSDINMRDNLGNTALTYARFIPENFSLLLDLGVDPSIPNYRGKTVIEQSMPEQVKNILKAYQERSLKSVEKKTEQEKNTPENKNTSSYKNPPLSIFKERN